MPGQPNFPLLSIDCSPVVQTDVAGIPSSLVIDRAAGMILKTTITVSGGFGALFNGKTWTARFFAESLEPGPNALISSVSGVFAGMPGNVPVTTPVVSGGALPADGLYRVSVVITVASAGPTTAFNEGPIVEITTP